jgi:hypothetical protein
LGKQLVSGRQKDIADFSFDRDRIPVAFVVTTIVRVHYYGMICEPVRR